MKNMPKVPLTTRLQVAWAVLCGRPVMYRMAVQGGVELDATQRGVMVVGNRFKGSEAA